MAAHHRAQYYVRSGLNQRITQWEQEQPKRRQKRVGRLAILSFAATAAVVAMLFALPQLRDDPQQAAPPAAPEQKQISEPRVLIEQILASAQLGQVQGALSGWLAQRSAFDLSPANFTAAKSCTASYLRIVF